MPMATGSAAITVTQRTQFTEGLAQAYQQTTSILVPYFEKENYEGELATFDRVGVASDMQEKTTRYAPNPTSEISADRRWIRWGTFVNGKEIDFTDVKKVVTDPTNAWNQALVYAMRRRADKTIIDNIFADVKTGQNAENTVSFVGTNSGKITVGALSKGQVRPITTTGNYVLSSGSGTQDYEGIDVALNYVDKGSAANSGVTLAKLKAVKSTMMRIHGLSEEQMGRVMLDCFITSDQWTQFLGIQEVISQEYALTKALAEGKVPEFMGYRFHVTEMLKGDGSSTTPHQVIVTMPRSLKYVEKEVVADMWNLTDKQYIPYLYTRLVDGAVRMWGETTARINCLGL